MITPEVIARINELAKKQREAILTEEERAEQAKLRRLYIDNIKNQIKAALDDAVRQPHSDDCGCGCNHKH
ncbi:DUF896 domain-containing protein [Anaeroselena agilis]|uniref:UPF0291 protein Q4T40_04555 n=1 Tax=Anaeroselena agilis TaxID=3063788 RepID=A0ABU3NUM2_9FIRM|nr:DUF896 domain-containing protein [Selenomonadales bacterium 4137-cl]